MLQSKISDHYCADNVLNFRKKIKDNENVKHFIENCSIEKSETITIIDFSCNPICDNNVDLLVEFLLQFKNVEYVDISICRITSSSWKSIILLFQLENLKYLCIYGNNSLAGKANIKNFQTMDKSFWKKLIFLSKNYIHDSLWKNVLNIEGDLPVTEISEVHEEFYFEYVYILPRFVIPFQLTLQCNDCNDDL